MTGEKSATAPNRHVISRIGEADSVGTLLGSITIVDTGATSTLISRKWFEGHCDWLRISKIRLPQVAPSTMAFRFGDGSTLPAIGHSFVAICFHGAWMSLDAHKLDALCPALLMANSL